jgi:hypothetical protein
VLKATRDQDQENIIYIAQEAAELVRSWAEVEKILQHTSVLS